MEIVNRSNSGSLELTDADLEQVSGGKDFDVGFGIHLFKMGDFVQVYTKTQDPVSGGLRV